MSIPEQTPPPSGCDMRMHGSVVVGSKWQIVIPSDARKLLGIEPGDTLFALSKNGKAMAFIRTEDIGEFMAYMQQEMEMIRLMAKENNNTRLDQMAEAEISFMEKLKSASQTR